MKKRKKMLSNDFIENQEKRILLMIQDCEKQIELINDSKEKENQIQILSHYQKILDLINNNPSSYGVCVRCNGDIEIQRLAVIPTAMVCKKCI